MHWWNEGSGFQSQSKIQESTTPLKADHTEADDKISIIKDHLDMLKLIKVTLDRTGMMAGSCTQFLTLVNVSKLRGRQKRRHMRGGSGRIQSKAIHTKAADILSRWLLVIQCVDVFSQGSQKILKSCWLQKQNITQSLWTFLKPEKSWRSYWKGLNQVLVLCCLSFLP